MKETLFKIVLAIVAILAPIHGAMGTALALVFVDTVTGVWAAKRRGEVITSKKLRDSVKKLVTYQTAIVLAFLTQKYMLADSVPVVNLVSGLIGINELLSCLENLNSISGSNLLQTAIDKLKAEKK